MTGSWLQLKRYTDNHTVRFVRFALGLRQIATSVSAAEHDLLGRLAQGQRCIVEVGVYEGATSRIFCREMDPTGTLFLVDPFIPEARTERLFGVSFTGWIANRAVQSWRDRVQFVRKPSRSAAEALPLQGKAGLIFIDARHDYDSVLEDFRSWTPMLGNHAVMAFHDSRVCDARPDLTDDVGPVRLMREVSGGLHGAWEVVGTADSVTAIRLRS